MKRKYIEILILGLCLTMTGCAETKNVKQEEKNNTDTVSEVNHTTENDEKADETGTFHIEEQIMEHLTVNADLTVPEKRFC